MVECTINLILNRVTNISNTIIYECKITSLNNSRMYPILINITSDSFPHKIFLL